MSAPPYVAPVPPPPTADEQTETVPALVSRKRERPQFVRPLPGSFIDDVDQMPRQVDRVSEDASGKVLVRWKDQLPGEAWFQIN